MSPAPLGPGTLTMPVASFIPVDEALAPGTAPNLCWATTALSRATLSRSTEAASEVKVWIRLE